MKELVVVDGVKYELLYLYDNDGLMRVHIKVSDASKGIQFPFDFMLMFFKDSPLRYQELRRDIKDTIKGFAHSKEARKVLYVKVIKCLVEYLRFLKQVK